MKLTETTRREVSPVTIPPDIALRKTPSSTQRANYPRSFETLLGIDSCN